MPNSINESAIKKLKLLFTVVDRNKGEFYLDVLSQYEVNFQTVINGTGTAQSEILDMLGLCIGVGAAIALSVTRIVLDFSLVYYVIPGYFISLALSLFVPPVYTAVAFDSGGVASGPMTSGFILPFATGVCVCLQGEAAVLRDAFGVVAVVAMTPLITIQLLGFKAIVSNRVREKRAMKRILGADDQQIINFM